MSLVQKTILIICASAAAWIAAFYFFSRSIILDSFDEIEAKSMRANVRRALNALQSDIDGLAATLGDWAAWDDTYQFIADRNAAYVENNLDPVALGNLRVDFLVFLDREGEQVMSAGCYADRTDIAEAPQSALDLIGETPQLRAHAAMDGKASGIAILPEGPVILASQPIIKSNRTGPIRGALIMGRWLGDAEIRRLAKQIELPLQLCPIASLAVPPDALEAIDEEAAASDEPLVRILNDEHIGGYGIVRDIAGQPAMAVQIELPREIYGRGRASVSLLAIFILCAGALFVLTMTLILHSEVLGGLLRLGDSVAAIGRSSDLGKRLDKQASPELQRLANEINCMLDSLERAESERIAREKLHAVLETAGAACHELNQPLQAIIGYCSLTEPSMDKDSIVFRNLKIIESQINRIAEITHKLQGISRYMTREYLEGRKIIDLDRSGGPNFEKISAG